MIIYFWTLVSSWGRLYDVSSENTQIIGLQQGATLWPFRILVCKFKRKRSRPAPRLRQSLTVIKNDQKNNYKLLKQIIQQWITRIAYVNQRAINPFVKKNIFHWEKFIFIFLSVPCHHSGRAAAVEHWRHFQTSEPQWLELL